LNPNETRAIDIRKLRDAQTPDFQGNLIPASATDGDVTWIHVQQLPVMGRLLVLQKNQGVASSYQCAGCPCPSYAGLALSPSYPSGSPDPLAINSSVQFDAIAEFTTCYNPVYSDVTDDATWTSYNAYVATVSYGWVTALGAGTAPIGASYTDATFLYEFSNCEPTGQATYEPTNYVAVGDGTPVVNTISPSPWVSGHTYTNGTISGENFGTAPTVSLSDSTIAFSYTPVNDGQINYTATIPTTTPSETVTVTVTSHGYNGSGFLPPPGGGLPSGANTTPSCGLTIANPTANSVFNLAGSSYNQASVPLQANSMCSGTVSWTLSYTYTTLTPATYTASSSTSTTLGQNSNYTTPVGVGGQVKAQAQATIAGQNISQSVVFFVLGTQIPNSTITTRLLGLYSGTTSGLLTGIAAHESSYMQFSGSELRMGITGYWPLGNAANSSTPADSYVGLMQEPNGMASGFDWYTNTSGGASIFQSKLTSASNYSSSQQSTYPSLPALSGVQLENEALVYYAGFASGTHYYTPNSTGTAWVVTTNTNVLTYVSTVRGGIL
jgi:hypothetical protein